MIGTDVLEISDLTVDIDGRNSTVRALDQVSLSVAAGEVFGLVGESGGGKSMLARSIVRQLPGRARVSGSVRVDGRDVFARDAETLRPHRGAGAALCFQTPRSSLSPARTVGHQIVDRLRAHAGMDQAEAWQAALALFQQVGIREPERRLRSFPHEMSGGQCQRVMIALALACGPRLLLADEPSTGLDVTLTRDILALIAAQAGRDRGVIVISHDLAAIAAICDRIGVLETGRLVEIGPTAQLLTRPTHPYTKRLVAAVPDINRVRAATGALADDGGPLLTVANADVVYRSRFGRQGHQALFDVSLSLRKGETLGIVGESGCGKSTLSRTIMGLIRPTRGRVMLDGIDLAGLGRSRLRHLRNRMQMVFQDPIDALNPRRSVAQIVADPLRLIRLDRAEQDRRIDAILTDVGLGPDYRKRRPHELSGGQAQRVGIARALVIDPALVVLDEPTSALDVTIQAQILELIRRLTARRDRGYLFVSHDLATVRSICDRVMVLSEGRVVEEGPTDRLFEAPQDPYTRRLLAAVPSLPTVSERHAGDGG